MTPSEKTVSAICAEILGLDRVDVDDDLYELGSDSHHAVLVALEIERVFAVDLPLEVMESTATVRDLAAWIDERLTQKKQDPTTPRVGQAGTIGDD